ncbi:carbohydrate ABC transporter membrane protein 2, CUT1 family [Clostridium amylolyticum]|uniref:Carbohydrate ABC transporter membrane protein 2, CUT1 family n=1 Tax=Clostridium amylolyticum TaxID=1121298 RepID=A0A1M6C7G3_9CLOT|nr:carbohydrate ABC transporter permease [Clostridium amylolyticum]SHI56980.1 carbohydrate ABC transporter membrane protein 2, CUT1 family [Clostridium amylolyticum]
MKKKKFKPLRAVFYLLLILYSVITLGPFLWSVVTSLKPSNEVMNMNINFKTLSFKNYINIFKNFPFLRWTLNSIVVALIVTLGNLIFNSMAGYALCRINFPGKDFLFIAILALMMIPGQVVMVPTYMLLSKLGWVNTYKGMTIPFLTSLFGIFLMRQFYFSIPKSVEEAAELDGLSRFGIFFRIIIPMSKTALSTQFILMFTGNWNSFLWPSLLATSSDMYTLPVGLNSFYGQYFQLWDQVLSGVMILSLPAIVIFLIFQKNFVKGIATSGMKE